MPYIQRGWSNAADVTVYFELDTIGNVRRLRGGHAVMPSTTEPPADLGGYRYTAFGKLYPADEGTPYPMLGGQPYEQFLRWQGRPQGYCIKSWIISIT